VEYFVQQSAASIDKSIESIPQETMRSLVRHPWPGNIRELQNYIARSACAESCAAKLRASRRCSSQA
jgi:transcriptional regulator with PAS, ATPase and Fis domain